MSLEEDYLMRAVAELTARVDGIERELRPSRFRAAESSEDASADQTATNYDDWTGAQLSDELGRRGLPKSGTKPELIARLVENDG